jgi:hypothetical protein
MTTTLTTGGRHVTRMWRDPLGRVGIAARGVLYLMLGLMAIQFARGDVSSEEVNQAGAFERLADEPLGRYLLLAVTAGLAAMTLWRLTQALVGDPVEGEEASDRAEFAAKAVIYVFLTVTAARITIDHWSGSEQSAAAAQAAGDQQQHKAASTLFDLPAGQWAVFALGLVLIGIALYQAYEYVIDASFMARLAPPRRLAGPIEDFGRVGYGARCVVLVVSGIFFLIAAAQRDASETKGISGSLAELASHPWGRAVLWATAVGLFIFGVYCLAESRYRRHS